MYDQPTNHVEVMWSKYGMYKTAVMLGYASPESQVHYWKTYGFDPNYRNGGIVDGAARNLLALHDFRQAGSSLEGLLAARDLINKHADSHGLKLKLSESGKLLFTRMVEETL